MMVCHVIGDGFKSVPSDAYVTGDGLKSVPGDAG